MSGGAGDPSERALRQKTLVVILVSLLAEALGNIYMTRGMKSVGDITALSPDTWLVSLQSIFGNEFILVGIAAHIAFFLLYLTVLSWADLSYVIGASSFGYVLNAVLARWMLGEHISTLRWSGTLLICAGVFLVSRTPPRTNLAPQQRADL